MNIRALNQYLATGMIDAKDAAQTTPDLKAHDARFHHGHYDGKSSCKYREALAKGDDADALAKAEKSEQIDHEKNSSIQQDYSAIEHIRGRVEKAARLLNGRAGNLQALQSSSRWQLLNDLPGDASVALNLSRLKGSSDPAVAKQAADLEKIVGDIALSQKGGWKNGVGMVPAALKAPGGAQPTGGSATPTANQPAKSGFSDDDAKAILGRVAKSINHHIDQGDFTPNAKAVAKYQAAKADIAKLNNPQLNKFCREIDSSLNAGNKTKVSIVPPPSQAWIAAHQPTMPTGGMGGGLGGLIAALMGGGFGGGMGGASQQSPRPKVKGKFSGQTWTPFSAKSDWEKVVSAANANHPAATDADWFKNQANKLTPQQAIANLEASGSIVKGGYRDSFDTNDPDEQELWAGWRPSKALSDDTARCVSVCFADLRKRFPNMPWKSNLEVRCGTKPMTGGQSTHTQDWRRHTVLFNCDYAHIWPSTGLGKSNYGHPDARFPFDVLRHEMGHALISGQLPNGKRMISKWHDAMTAAYGNPADDLEKFAGKFVSSYAVTRKSGGFSMAECLSECFSLATSPDYKPGYLPLPVEDFIFGEMLGMKK